LTAGALPTPASESWPGIRAEVFGARPLHDGRGLIKLTAPYRPEDVRSVPISVETKLANGRTIKSVSFIVDENPSPVAAVFKLGGARERVALTTNIRLNQQSDVRIVVEASDGELYMVEQLVKFAGGQASCSAPPMGDPAEIALSMGRMDFAAVGEKATASHSLQRARFGLSHPNHTGMVLDQITLLYMPLLMVERIEARQGDELVFEMTGSITLAQNPRIEFDYVTNGAAEMTVSARDTSGAAWERRFPIGPAG
jgi:sulfur-oxidizing protein SoxY